MSQETIGQAPRTYEEAVRTLSRWHAEDHEETGLEAIYVFPDDRPDVEDRKRIVRMIDVTEQTIPTDEVMAFGFASSDMFPYRTHAAQVTPREWQRILRGEIPLPEGWDLSKRQRMWPDDGE